MGEPLSCGIRQGTVPEGPVIEGQGTVGHVRIQFPGNVQYGFQTVLWSYSRSVVQGAEGSEYAAGTPFQSEGSGAVSSKGVFFTGWMKLMCLAVREMLPSLLERGAPYFRSPLITAPWAASWHLIW